MKSSEKIFFAIAVFAVTLISWQVMGPILNNDTVVQDDFRQSMFWLWRNWDPELFPENFSANLYSTMLVRLPILGFIYALAPFITDSLVWFSKFLALLTAIVSGAYAYLYFLKLSKNKYISLAFTIALATIFWATDHISAAQARSFIWPVFLVYLYYKEQQKHISAGLTTFISLFISPIAFLMVLGAEFFSLLLNRPKDLINFKDPTTLSLAVNSIAVVLWYKVLVPDSACYIEGFSDGRILSVEELKKLPEFLPGGRHPIFGSSIWDGSWWENEHWGLGIGYLEISQIIIIAAVLALIYFVLQFFKGRNPLEVILSAFRSSTGLIFLSSLSLYAAAQVLFPALYMPSRYLNVSTLLISAVVIFFVSFSLLKELFAVVDAKSVPNSNNIASIGVIVISLFFWFYYKDHYFTRYVSMSKQAKEILEDLPYDSLIAGHPLHPDLNNASAIAKRSVFIDYEHSTPSYNEKVLEEVRRRNVIALALTYTESREEAIGFMEENGITDFLAHKAFYSKDFIARGSYIEPYNDLHRKLLARRNFFFEKYLDKLGANYAVVPLSALKQID